MASMQNEIPHEWLSVEWQLQQVMTLMGLLQSLPVLGSSAEEVVQMKEIIKRLHAALRREQEIKPELTGEKTNVTSDSNTTS